MAQVNRRVSGRQLRRPCSAARASLPCLPNGRSIRPSHFLSARFDHGSLQRALHLLHAARIAGMAAARRHSHLRGNAAADSDRRGTGRVEGAHHRRRTAHAPRCPFLFRNVASIPGIDDIGLSTNGTLLARDCSRRPVGDAGEGRQSRAHASHSEAATETMAQALRAAGVNSVNISLDTLDREAYAQTTGRDFLPASARRNRRRDRRGISADQS